MKIVLAASLVFSLFSITEAMGIKYRFIAFTPQLLPSSYHPFMAFKHQGFPRWVNRMGWNLITHLDKLNLTRQLNINRRKIGLAPLTTARSGVPQIIGPHILDQYFWGNQIHKSKLGPKPIWRAKLTSDNLSEAIKESVTSQELINNARGGGEKLRRKNPLEMAVREIERRA